MSTSDGGTVSKKYPLPTFLVGITDQAAYLRWLSHKAQTHVKRDRKRGNAAALCGAYRMAIHAAVITGEGRDSYTGEELDWRLLSRYDNTESSNGGRIYKHGFAKLPTVDHVGDGLGAADFRICGWRVNDAKHDLDIPAFLDVCKAVLQHHGFSICPPVVTGSDLVQLPA